MRGAERSYARLMFSFACQKRTRKAPAISTRWIHEKGAERKKEILKLIKVNSTITQVEIMKELDLTRKQVQKDMKELQEMHIIAREGTNRRGRWIIVKENK